MPKNLPTIKRKSKTIFRSTMVRQCPIINIICFLPITSSKQTIFTVQHTESELVSWTKTFTNRIMSNLPKHPPMQEMNFLPGCRGTSCTGVNASMTGGTMIIAGLNYGMSFGVMKQSRAKNQEQSSDFYFMWVLCLLLLQSHGFGKIPTKWIVSVCKRRVEIIALWFRMDTASMSWQF